MEACAASDATPLPTSLSPSPPLPLPLAVRRLSCGLAKTKFVFAFVLLKNCCFSLSLACFAILFNAILLRVLFFTLPLSKLHFFSARFFFSSCISLYFFYFSYILYFFLVLNRLVVARHRGEARSEHIKTRSYVDSTKHFLGIMKLRHFW